MYAHFNSIKVQLEPLWTQFDRWFIQFQFHKGTIRTQEQNVEPTQEKNFNSIKVQLELTLMTENRKVMVNFNSIKVQLEPPADKYGPNRFVISIP